MLEECANLINQGNARAALAHLDAHEAEVRPVVQAWQAARFDDELPVEILDAIRRSGALDRRELATLWLDTLSKLGTGGFLRAYDARQSPLGIGLGEAGLPR